MEYLVTFTDGSMKVMLWEELFSILQFGDGEIASYEPYVPDRPTAEELVYANWLRTGGTGSMAYWRSLDSPLFYTPPPEPEPEPPVVPEYKGTMIKKEMEYNGSRKSIPIY